MPKVLIVFFSVSAVVWGGAIWANIYSNISEQHNYISNVSQKFTNQGTTFDQISQMLSERCYELLGSLVSVDSWMKSDFSENFVHVNTECIKDNVIVNSLRSRYDQIGI